MRPILSLRESGREKEYQVYCTAAIESHLPVEDNEVILRRREEHLLWVIVAVA